MFRKKISEVSKGMEEQNKVALLPPAVHHFIQTIKPSCSTILLGGSRAQDQSTPDSDVDLCLICPEDQHKSKILTALRSTIDKVSKDRVLIDAKVYTQSEFQAAIFSTQNLFLYTLIRESLLLHGYDVRTHVKLVPRLMRETVWEATQVVEDALNLLEYGAMWNLACYKLWTALMTFFVADQIFQGHTVEKTAKTTLFRRIFGSAFTKVKERYEVIRWQMRRQETTDCVRVRRSKAVKKLKKLKPIQLLEAGRQIRDYGNRIYQALSQ